MADPNKKTAANSKDIEENKMVAVIGYIWILCLVPLFLKRQSPFAQFHGKQGLVLFIWEIVLTPIAWIPIIGWGLWVLTVIVAVMAIIKTNNGEMWKLPVLGDIATKINL